MDVLTRVRAMGAAAAAAVAVTACSCPPPNADNTGWAGDPHCAQVREAVAHGEAVDYVTYPERGWMLHTRQYFTTSPMEDACWREGGDR